MAQQKQIPVYLFTGFLEGGKTHIIQESMEDKRFNSGEKTLIIQCEEGLDELDPSQFWGQNVHLQLIESEDELTEEVLSSYQKQHQVDRIIIEYNGMWMIDKLYAAMPRNWGVFQEMMFADASTFLSYNANMRQLMVDKLTGAEMVILNRTPDDIDKETIHKVIRGINRRCGITYDYPDGHVEYDEIEDPLPYDMNADIIDIDAADYAVFYRDSGGEHGGLRGKDAALCRLGCPRSVARQKLHGDRSARYDLLRRRHRLQRLGLLLSRERRLQDARLAACDGESGVRGTQALPSDGARAARRCMGGGGKARTRGGNVLLK